MGFLDGAVGFTLALLRYETTVMKYVDLKVKKKKLINLINISPNIFYPNIY